MMPSDLFQQWDAYQLINQLPPQYRRPGCRVGRHSLRDANRELRKRGALPRPRYAQKVILTAIPIPIEIQAKRLKAFHPMKNGVWLRNRRLAKRLVELDRALGGQGFMQPVEYRRCRVCRRLLVGHESWDYRERMREPKQEWDTPFGQKCGVECRLNPRRKKA